ncbi:hypothetical protein ABEU20_002471 [Rhodococcus sp. PAM 2766]|uniref:Transposase n=1 Tax=Rhodococcus parequi TaxID=3137122 RepID=A0ABW9FEZ1_9NOCA
MLAYDPAQRVALLPTYRFRDRAIGLIRGFVGGAGRVVGVEWV